MSDTSHIATFGYILGGSVTGYIFSRIYRGDMTESILVGSVAGCSIGLIKQYKRSSKVEKNVDHNGNETIIKHGNENNNSITIGKIIVAVLAWKLAVPITILSGSIAVAVLLNK